MDKLQLPYKYTITIQQYKYMLKGNSSYTMRTKYPSITRVRLKSSKEVTTVEPFAFN